MSMKPKTVAELKKEILQKYYPDGPPTFEDYSVGDRVKVITPSQDFYFFYKETGVISNIKNHHLGINVKFDVPREFTDGSIQRDFNFNPEDLYIIEKKGVINSEKLNRVERYWLQLFPDYNLEDSHHSVHPITLDEFKKFFTEYKSDIIKELDFMRDPQNKGRGGYSKESGVWSSGYNSALKDIKDKIEGGELK